MKQIYSTFSAVSALLSLVLLSACKPAATQQAFGPSEALGKVLAEETVQAASGKQVVLITPKWKPGASSTVEDSFKTEMKKKGMQVVTLPIAVGDPMNPSGVGLKADDFFAAVSKADGGAVVSLAGAPLLGSGDLNRLDPNHPPLLVVATASLGNMMGVFGDRARLTSLVEAKVIRVAIVDGAAPDHPPAANTDAVHRTFAENYSLLRSAN